MAGEWDFHASGDGHDGTNDDGLHDLGGGYDFASHALFADHDFAAGSELGGSELGGSDLGGSELGGHEFGGHDFGTHDFGGDELGGRDYVSADDLGGGHDVHEYTWTHEPTHDAAQDAAQDSGAGAP